jgi:hypothetical protein
MLQTLRCIHTCRRKRWPGRFYEEKLGFKPEQATAGGVVYGFKDPEGNSRDPEPLTCGDVFGTFGASDEFISRDLHR